MTKIDIISSLPHYHRHMLPIYAALPPELRGDYHPGRAYPEPGNVGLVAAWSDLEPLRANYPYFYVEHGAGQTYGGDIKSAAQPGYSLSGGHRHYGCLGFISPSETVAKRWETAPAVAVGCPKLDDLRKMENPGWGHICIAFHWMCEIAPEARSAWPHYESGLPRMVESLKRQGFFVYGHGHPKWNGALRQPMEEAGAIYLDDEWDVFEQCGSLVMDNSSLMYEFASLRRPVIALNAPWFRKDVEHGLRFWAFSPGMEFEGPDDFTYAPMATTLNVSQLMGRDAAEHAYAHQDDQCAQRAADFIVCRLRELGRVV